MPTHHCTIIAVIACTLLAGGCDSIHGVSRTIPLDSIPSADSVLKAILATPNVTDVSRRDIPPTDSWSLHKGAIHEPGYAQFYCHDDYGAFVTVEPCETSDGDKQLYVYSIWMNHVPTHKELVDARRLIDKVCESLHDNVPGVPISAPGQDKFIGAASP